jgi:hypothetical protein
MLVGLSVPMVVLMGTRNEEPRDPNVYQGWTYDQLLAEAKRVRAVRASRWKNHPELGPLKDELGEIARSPEGFDSLSEERRARFDELMKQIDDYPIHDPWAHEASAVETAIYLEVVPRPDLSTQRLADDLGIWVGYINIRTKVADRVTEALDGRLDRPRA